MGVGEFQDLIDRWGEDISCWPDAQRWAAVDLVTSSAEARMLLEDARRLRHALSAPPVCAPADLADRIVTAAKRQAPEVAPDAEATSAAAETTEPG